MSTVRLEIEITADNGAWADHFNLESQHEAHGDMHTYLTSPEALDAVRDAVRALTGAPITVAVKVLPRVVVIKGGRR